jgi:hypothetical protein
MNADIASIITASSGLVIGVFTVVTSLYKTNGIRKENKAAKAEIENLKTRLAQFTTNPLALKNGIYHDADGNTYCPACYGSPYERIPLKMHIQRGSWTQYQCPKCHEEYDVGSPPPPPHKKWDPLA